ncbi:MAG TPA: c-type cytochrome domain-containing protein, partial [Vicinamibacterales bacterium]|nr:c-type cytochrome domain-containing protein [Vicinamibacterales bacterium]
MRTPLIWFVAAGVAAAGALSVRSGDLAAAAPLAIQTAAQAAPVAADADSTALVGKYCVTCHNDRLKTAGLSLQNLDLADVPDHAAVWEKVTRKLRSGEMPPASVRSRPDPKS